MMGFMVGTCEEQVAAVFMYLKIISCAASNEMNLMINVCLIDC